MNDLDALEALYPAPPRLTETDRAAMRSELFGTPTTIRHRTELRARRWMAVAASVVVVAGAAGIWAVSANRSGEQPSPPADRPATASSIEPTRPTGPGANAGAAPDGAMVLDRLPAALADAVGHTYVGAAEASGPPFPDGTWVQRWYTASMDRPELAPRLKLATASASPPFTVEIPPTGVDATSVTVRGGIAWLYDDPDSGGRVVAFTDGETVFVLTGYQLSDDQLVGAAGHAVLAGGRDVGAVIEPGWLPADLVERAVGIVSERGFTTLETLQRPQASVRWYRPRTDGGPPSDGAPMLWLAWEAEDPALVALHRLDDASVSDTTVHGVPAFVGTNDDPVYLGIVWSEHGYTYTLGAWGLDRDAALEAADQLRPATDAEWNALDVEPG